MLRAAGCAVQPEPRRTPAATCGGADWGAYQGVPAPVREEGTPGGVRPLSGAGKLQRMHGLPPLLRLYALRL